MIERSFLVLLAITACGCDSVARNKDKIYVRRVPPVEEEVAARPPTPYEVRIQREMDREVALSVEPSQNPQYPSIKEESRYYEEGRRATAPYLKVPHDPWASYEADRITVIQSYPWIDVGKAPPPEVIPKVEKPIENDPFAPVLKQKKKGAEDEGEKSEEGGDKGEKKMDAPKKDDTNKN
ncbi:MAG TPA: hypothetical protein VFF73_19105 [Planctomycetota bacterium]|nr:hypothetical protein [Planctomycetota bacterium]